MNISAEAEPATATAPETETEIASASTTTTDTAPVAAAGAYGGFALGTLQLALPMAALREVLPCSELADLPCPAPCVIGGLALRGTTLPVVDLRLLLGRASPAITFPTVIVMAHGGRLLGLLADSVTGVFEAEPGSFRRALVADATASIYEGGVQRADAHTLVSVLSPAALAALHQVPMAADDAACAGSAGPASPDALDSAMGVPMMLMHCGAQSLAVPAMLVRATLSHPEIHASALARGDCLGTLTHNGTEVPVVDLLALCGLGVLDRSASMQAFLIALAAGQVAFVVSDVVDIVRAQPGDIVRLPRFALPRPELFAGALPTVALPTELAARAGADVNQFLVIDGDALQSNADVVCLSQANTRSETDENGVSGARVDAIGALAAMTAAPGRRSMITYHLAGEKATPLSQVTEILSYAAVRPAGAAAAHVLGFVINRGRSIPVLCLAQLAGLADGADAEPRNVLVVESHGERVGFAVSSLKSIEQADWEPELPDFDARVGPGQTRARGRGLVLVGSGDAERMLPVLDLDRIVGGLQSQSQSQSQSQPQGAAAVAYG